MSHFVAGYKSSGIAYERVGQLQGAGGRIYSAGLYHNPFAEQGLHVVPPDDVGLQYLAGARVDGRGAHGVGLFRGRVGEQGVTHIVALGCYTVGIVAYLNGIFETGLFEGCVPVENTLLDIGFQMCRHSLVYIENDGLYRLGEFASHIGLLVFRFQSPSGDISLIIDSLLLVAVLHGRRGEVAHLGIADRTDYDLGQHAKHSGEAMDYFDPETGEHYTPYVIEPSLGADRVTLAFLVDAYDEEVIDAEKNDVRTVLHLHPALAPMKAAVLPLSKKLTEEALPLYDELSKHFAVDFDDAGSIGKRYRREDEIGTPFCITYDFDSKEDGCVTVRDRDTMEQVRIPMTEVKAYIEARMDF